MQLLKQNITDFIFKNNNLLTLYLTSKKERKLLRFIKCPSKTEHVCHSSKPVKDNDKAISYVPYQSYKASSVILKPEYVLYISIPVWHLVCVFISTAVESLKTLSFLKPSMTFTLQDQKYYDTTLCF